MVENPEAGVRYFLVKPSDVAIYVEHGAADIGIVGKDILTESGADVYELLDTGMGKCRMCVAGPRNFVDDESRALRVATKFVNIARAHYESIGRDIDIIKLNGSIELAPILGLSDVIVDIVETGTTLKENNLTVLEEFMPISARFIDLICLYNARFTNSSVSLSIAFHLRSALYPDYSTNGGILQRYLFTKGLQIDFFGAVWYNKDK